MSLSLTNQAALYNFMYLKYTFLASIVYSRYMIWEFFLTFGNQARAPYAYLLSEIDFSRVTAEGGEIRQISLCAVHCIGGMWTWFVDRGATSAHVFRHS